ncbi:MAG: alanine dehydrogenase [Armatimonadota bacterium]
MVVGVPREVKESEYRVGLVPAGVEALCAAGHKVLVESEAGAGTGISDEEYESHGAKIVSAAEVWEQADLVVKVKEPVPAECGLVRPGQIVFTFFHFAANPELAAKMMERGAVCIAYETIQTDDGRLPLLIPMSEVAGRMSVQEGAKYLERPMEGRGILLGGVPGVEPARVLILGGGVVGSNAAKVAAGLGAQVTVMDTNLDRLRHLADIMPPNVTTVVSNSYNIRKKLPEADLVIGAVLVPGARTPILITRDMLKLMKPRAVIVDVAVDQGGCVETTRPTTHRNPVYLVDGIVHYGVTNIPGAVAGTSTYALTNASLPYVLQIANLGYKEAARRNPEICRGLNIVDGVVVHKKVAEACEQPYSPVEDHLR